jgi:neuromedin U receptor 1
VAVVLAFFICWAPFHVQRLLATYAGSFAESHNDSVLLDVGNQTFGLNETNTSNESTSSDDTIAFIYYSITNISGVLYFISTCINPFLYNIMSNKFREAFKVGEVNGIILCGVYS